MQASSCCINWGLLLSVKFILEDELPKVIE